MKKTLFFSLLIAVVISSSSCKKGDKGDPGTNGTNGTNGAAGNTSIGSYTFTTTSASWLGSGTQYFYSYQNFSMNTEGIVEVFAFDAALSGWRTLPLVNSNISCSSEVFPTLSNVWIYFEPVDGTTAIGNPGAWTFKVITLPPAIVASHPNINFKNYNEIKQNFNLN